MALTEEFYSAVAQKDVKLIRIMMSDSMLTDPSFSEFDEMESACSGLSNLYEVHDGRSLDEDKSDWNDDYMNMLMVQVAGNFSRERVEHLKQVVRYLRPVEEYSVPTNSAPVHHTTNTRPRRATKRPRANSNDDLQHIVVGSIGGAIVGGVVVAVAGVVSVPAGVVIGAVAGGVYSKTRADKRK